MKKKRGYQREETFFTLFSELGAAGIGSLFLLFSLLLMYLFIGIEGLSGIFHHFTYKTGWLTLKNVSLPKACYYEQKGSSYKVKVRNFSKEGITIVCSNGREVTVFFNGKVSGNYIDENHNIYYF